MDCFPLATRMLLLIKYAKLNLVKFYTQCDVPAFGKMSLTKKYPLYGTVVSNGHLVETKVLPAAVIVVNSHIFQPNSKGVRIWCVTLCCSRRVFSLTPRCSTMASSSRRQGRTGRMPRSPSPLPSPALEALHPPSQHVSYASRDLHQSGTMM